MDPLVARAAPRVNGSRADRPGVRSRSGRVDFWRPVDGESWQLAETTGAGEPAPQTRPWIALA